MSLPVAIVSLTSCHCSVTYILPVTHSVTESLPTIPCDVDPLQLQKFEQLKWNISPETEADLETAKANISKLVIMAVLSCIYCARENLCDFL